MNLTNWQGTHRDGRAVSNIYFVAGGFGALDGLDGADTLPGPSNMAVTPVEVWESLTSMTVERKQLLPDTGGPGASRGGLGQRIDLRNDSGHPVTVSCLAARTEFPARGFRGGRPGARRGVAINGEPVHAKGQYRLAPGDRISMIEAGGGGFGDPRDRAPEAITRDLREGFVTPEGARRDYGVEVDGNGAVRR